MKLLPAPLDILISAILIGIMILLGMGTLSNGEVSGWYKPLLFFYLSLLFLAAYLNQEKLMLFKLQIWICKNFSFPRGIFMALVYAGGFFLAATYLVVKEVYGI